MIDMPWIKSYPPGVRWDAEIPLMPVQQILEESALKWPNNPAVDFMGRKISYRELNDLANRAANGLQKLGVKPGVHVGLYLPNTPHYLVSLFGVLKAGGTVVNYSPLDAAKVLEHKIEDSYTDFLITLDMASLYPQMAAMLGKTRLKKLIVGNLGEMSAQPDAVNAQMQATKQRSGVPNDDRHIAFRALLNKRRHLPQLSDRRSDGCHCGSAIYRRHDWPAEGRDVDPCQSDGRHRSMRRNHAH
jgi:long-chain acyl-CoA synthetase